MTIRSFISIELPDGIRRSVAELIAGLRTAGTDVSWVRADNLHLTLKFLGSTEDALMPKIKERISKKLSHYTAFYIKVEGVGCFPSERRPRVLWIGMENSDLLKSIQQDIDAEAAELGFPPEVRPYSPHLTIGRVRSQRGIAEMLRKLAAFRTYDFGVIEVRSLHIMKSELTSAGAEYTSIAEIPIGRGRNDVKGIE